MLIQLVRQLRLVPALLLAFAVSHTSGASVATSVASNSDESSGQQWRVEHPRDGSRISSDEFYVAVSLRAGYSVDPSSVTLELDGKDISDHLRVNSASITAVVTSSLKKGIHTLELTGRGENGHHWQPLKWSFSVDGPLGDADVVVAESPTTTSSGRDRMSFTGSALVSTRNASLSGNKLLKQEPLSTQTLGVDIVGSYKSLTFPIRLQLTTNESAFLQPRNRFLVGVESSYGALHLGDTNPELNELMGLRSRTRGVLVKMNASFLHLQVSRGQLARGVDQLSSFVGGPGIGTTNGVYTRNITSVRLGFGNPNSVLFSLSGMRATDDSVSAISSLQPLQNLIVGADLDVNAISDRLQISLGSAMSVTTEDISRGASKKSEIDSLFQTDIPINPASFSPLIILNPTTYPLRLDELTSLSWFAKSTLRLPSNTLKAEVRKIGSAYFSAANPYLQPNRSSVHLSNNFRYLNNRLTGTASYFSYVSAPDAVSNAYKLESSTIAGSIGYRHSDAIPRITGGVRHNSRTRSALDPVALGSSSTVRTYSTGLSHAFEAMGARHAVSLSFARTNRTDKLNADLSSTNNAFTAVLTEQFRTPIYLSTQFSLLRLHLGSIDDVQNWTTASLLVGYRFNFGLNASARYSTTLSNDTPFAPRSNRHGVTLQSTYDIGNNMQFEVQLGIDRFAQPDASDFNYNEQFLSVRHRYTF